MPRSARAAARVTRVLAVALAALAGAGRDDARAAEPTFAVTRPAPEPPVTWHEVRDQYAAFNRATCSGAYQQVGTHGPWDADAIRFLERMEVYFTGGAVDVYYDPPNIPTQQELLGDGRALVDAGCTDPLVVYCYAAILHDSGDVAGAAEPLHRCVMQMLAGKYPPYRKLAAAQRLLKVATDPNVRRRLAGAAEHNAVLLTRGPLSYAERRKVLESLQELHDAKPPAQRMAAVKAMEGTGSADPWLVDMMAGHAHVKLAWEARGGGVASTVTDDGWRGFHEHLALARDRFTRAWKLAPELPEAPAMMITVAKGAGDVLGEDPATWLDRALAAQLDYTDAYEQMTGGPLLPRWGGSYDAMFALGLRAARSGRYDTALPYQLIDVVIRIVKDDGGSWGFVELPGVYEEVARVCDGYADALKDSPKRAAFYTSLRAAAAWRAGRLGESRRVLERLGDRVDPHAFTVMRSQTPHAAIGYVYAITSPEAARVRRAEAALAAGDAAAALIGFRAAGAALAAEEATHPYFEARVTLLERRERLAKGEWVDLKPDVGLTGWQTVGGTWTVAKDSSIFCSPSRTTRTPILLLNEEVGTRFEITGRLLREGPWAGGVAFRAGERHFADVTLSARSVDVTAMGQRIYATHAQPPATVEFSCRFDGRHVTFVADGKTLLDAFPLPLEFGAAAPRVGLVVLPDGRARFLNLRVRRILDEDDAAPAAQDAPPPAADDARR
jgi:hypothetical protein